MFWFTIFSLSYGIFAGIRAGLLLFSTLSNSRKIHKKMVASLLYAPITQFFERMPLGRILNRFSKDLTVLVNLFLIYLFFFFFNEINIYMKVCFVLKNFFNLII